MGTHALQPIHASASQTAPQPRQVGRIFIAAAAAGLALILLIMALAKPAQSRQRWIAPQSTDQLQSFPARPDVLDVR